MAEQQTTGAAAKPPHPAACPCLACADWRQWRRELGLRGSWPLPAVDWRGVRFVP